MKPTKQLTIIIVLTLIQPAPVVAEHLPGAAFQTNPPVPVINVQPAQTIASAHVSQLPGRPRLGIFQNLPNVQASSFQQISDTRVRFNYDVRPAGTFSALAIQFDDFGTTAVETQSLLGKTLVFSLRDPGKLGTVIMEVEDYFHQKAEVVLTGVDGTERFYSVSTSLFQGINLTRLRGIAFVIKEENIGGITTGQMEDYLRQSGEYQSRGGAAAGEITGLYLDMLGRLPDDGGQAYWLERLRSETPLTAIAQAFRNSQEFAARIQSIFPTLIKSALGRDATPQEYADWTGRLTRGEVNWTELGNELLKYAQARGASSVHVRAQREALIQNLYQTYLGRASDSGGLGYFVARLEAGAKVAEVITTLRSSPEYMQDFGRAHQVRSAYNRLFGREPDAAGFDYWTQQLKRPSSTLEIRLGDHPFTPIVRPTPPTLSSLTMAVPYDLRLQRR